MTRAEILGREESRIKALGTKGCGFLGKIVTYPAGKYEEVGPMYVDIVSPHCILVLGKRGTGKSYTLGVLAEEFGLLEKEYRDRIAVLIIDTMSVFHSLKRPNTNPSEIARMGDFGNLVPRGFGDYAKIFIPQITIDKLQEEHHSIVYDELLQFSLRDVDAYDWLSVFDFKPTEPAGVILCKVINSLHSNQEFFGFDDIYTEISAQRGDEYVKDSLINMFEMVEALKLFDRVGTPYSTMVKGGQLSILDISYLGRTAGFDLRTLVVALIARRLLGERTLYATLEMQSEANLIEERISKDITKEHPLVYMMLDEAHLFLPAHEKTLSTEVLLDWIKLGRHPGLSLVFATQEPSSLHESAIRQCDLMIAHSITSSDDVSALGKAKQTFMRGSRDIQHIVSTMEFKKGLAMVFDDNTRKIEMCMVRPRLTLHTGLDATAIPHERVRERGREEPKIYTRPPSRPGAKEHIPPKLVRDLKKISREDHGG